MKPPVKEIAIDSMLAYVVTHESCGGWIMLSAMMPGLSERDAEGSEHEVLDLVRKGYTLRAMKVADARSVKCCECPRAKGGVA